MQRVGTGKSGRAPQDALRQRTIARPVTFSGIGLHCGLPVACILHPADPDTGIVFIRTDVSDRDNRIPADWGHIRESQLCTRIGNKAGVEVQTIEHLMAALAGFEIDNALIEINGPEVPIMDGSAEPFMTLLESAGAAEQTAARRFIRVLKPVSVTLGDAEAKLVPADEFSIDFEIEFEAPAIGRQQLHCIMINGNFRHELSAARTFGVLEDVERLQEAGFALGGSLENAIVVDRDLILNKGGLRFDDEFVRHKMLDSMGDLYLAGAPILGAFQGVRSSHALNCALVTQLLKDESAWETDYIDADSRRPIRVIV